MGNEHLTDLPHDIEAERWLLACMMTSPAAVAEAAEAVAPDDFYRPAHQDVFMALVTMFAVGEPANPVTLADFMTRQMGGMPAGLDRLYLFDLYQLPAITAAVVSHAEIVHRLAQRRRAILAGNRIVQAAMDPGLDVQDALAHATEVLAEAEQGTADYQRGRMTALTLTQFRALSHGRTEAVIPGLLDHQDRVLVVGLEGDGKSMLAHQVAMAAWAGWHPFAEAAIPPQRVVIMDFETPHHLLTRRFDRLQAAGERYGKCDEDRLTVVHEPGGIDLTQAGDRLRVAEKIRRAQADLVVAGPVYKMFRDRGQGAEQLHSQITQFWDRIRSRYGPALWLETHPAKGAVAGARKLEPFGSSIYMRWPEFGITLERARNHTWRLGRFRGDREEGRPWPESIVRSTAPQPCWPWAARYPQGTFGDMPS